MKVDIGWLFTATLFGLFLGKWFADLIPVLSLVILIAHIVYAFCMTYTETH